MRRWRLPGSFLLRNRCSLLMACWIVWGKKLGCRAALSSQLSVLSSQFSVLSSQFSVLSSQFSVLSSQFSVLSSFSYSAFLEFQSIGNGMWLTLNFSGVRVVFTENGELRTFSRAVLGWTGEDARLSTI